MTQGQGDRPQGTRWHTCTEMGTLVSVTFAEQPAQRAERLDSAPQLPEAPAETADTASGHVSL